MCKELLMNINKMTEWKTYKIGDIIDEIAMGPFGSNIKVDNFIDFGVPVLNGANLQGFKLKEESFNYVSSQKADSLGKANAYRGDVVITHRGTLGQIVYIPNDSKFDRYIISQSQFRVRLNSQYVLPEYFVYYFHTRLGQHKLLMNASQVGVPALARPTSTFKEITIALPPLEEQRRIAGILGAIDDKIENNRRINANLESQAQALYKQWFVDNRSDDWEEKPLAEIINIYDSLRKPLSGQQRDQMDKIYPYYGAASLMDYVDDYLFDGEYLLLGEDGTVVDDLGYPILQYVWGKFWVNNHAHVLTGKNGFSTESIYILLKQTNVKSIVTGAVQPKISQANLKNIQVTIPESSLLSNYNDTIKPIFRTIRNNTEQIKQLTTLRDTLLPKLMNGEIKL